MRRDAKNAYTRRNDVSKMAGGKLACSPLARNSCSVAMRLHATNTSGITMRAGSRRNRVATNPSMNAPASPAAAARQAMFG